MTAVLNMLVYPAAIGDSLAVHVLTGCCHFSSLLLRMSSSCFERQYQAVASNTRIQEEACFRKLRKIIVLTIPVNRKADL